MRPLTRSEFLKSIGAATAGAVLVGPEAGEVADIACVKAAAMSLGVMNLSKITIAKYSR